MGVDIKGEQRNAFYLQAKKNGSNLREPGVLIGEARAQAGSNPYAKALWNRERGDRLKMDQAKTEEIKDRAEIYGGAAQGMNVVGDAFTFGAHRNLMKAGERLSDGDYRGAAAEVLTSGGKVGGSALLNGIGQVGKGLNTLAQSSKLGSGSATVLSATGKAASKMGTHAVKAKTEATHWGHAYMHNTQHRDLQHNALNGSHGSESGSTLNVKH